MKTHQPKPTGEWTADTDILRLLGDEKVGIQWQIICYAHNAAIAAALKSENKRMMEFWQGEREIQERQLDAEREKKEKAIKLWRDNERKVGELATALAAEREEHCKDCCCARSWEALGITESTGMSIPEHIQQLRKQLAAEKEKVQPLVDALKKYMLVMDAIYNHNEAARVAVKIHFGTLHSLETFDALAKVGK